MKSCGLTIQMETIEQYFHMVLFIFKDFTKSNLGSVLNFDFRHFEVKGLICDTVKTCIKEHVFWGFRLILFLYIGCFLQN